jgi:hypothetical protein
VIEVKLKIFVPNRCKCYNIAFQSSLFSTNTLSAPAFYCPNYSIFFCGTAASQHMRWRGNDSTEQTCSSGPAAAALEKDNLVSASDGKSKLGVVDQSRACACVSALKETNDDPRVLVWHSQELAELQAEQILSRN